MHPGSACHICPLQGLSLRLTAQEGEFLNKELCAAFETVQISWSGTVCSWVFLGHLYLPSPPEFLLGGFASHSRSELLASQLFPSWHRWPMASAAIWANCWVRDDCGNLPTSYSHSTSSTCFIISSMALEGSPALEMGGVLSDWWSFGCGKYLCPCLDLPLLCYFHVYHLHLPLVLSLMGCNFCSCHTRI